MVIGIGYAELSAAALLEFITRAARARIVSTSLSCFSCCTVRQLSPTPVIVDRHNAAGQERRCFGRNALFLFRLEAEQRFAVFVAGLLFRGHSAVVDADEASSLRLSICLARGNRWFADSLLEGSGFEPSVPAEDTIFGG